MVSGWALDLEAPEGFEGLARAAAGDGVGQRAVGGGGTDLSPVEAIADPIALGEGGAALLELEFDPAMADRLADQPLRAHLVDDPSDADGAGVFAFDGEFWLPVGGAGAERGTLEIGWLPEPDQSAIAADGQRGIGNTLKLYFGKARGATDLDIGLRAARFVASADESENPPLPGERSYPVEGGSVRYAPLADGWRPEPGARVATVVHGFNSDTRAIVALLGEFLRGGSFGYDHVLAFDYESLGTSVAENGSTFADALRAVGFGADDGVRLEVFAHSMGTVVTRSMIEVFGGDAFVDLAVLAGPPNRGTPLANSRRMLPWIGGLLMNGILGPIGLLASGAGAFFVNAKTTGLDDLQPGSAFLEMLNGNRSEVSVPYRILAGRAVPAEGKQGMFERLAKKLHRGSASALGMLFDDAHDMVIPMSSMCTVREGAFPSELLEVKTPPCHHCAYFECAEVDRSVTGWLA